MYILLGCHLAIGCIIVVPFRIIHCIIAVYGNPNTNNIGANEQYNTKQQELFSYTI